MRRIMRAARAGCEPASVVQPAEGIVVDLEREIVDVAPPPLLAGLVGAHQRMRGGVEVRGGVLAGRVVAAADVAALQAETEVQPATAAGQAFHAAVAAR